MSASSAPGSSPADPSGARRYELVWPSVSAQPPVLDEDQRAVVDAVAVEGCGPLLVLAGPGTGKTTTLVEAVAARVAAGTAPERVLVLTFGRKAAQELRARLGARLARATVAPLAWTFHGFCFRLLDEWSRVDPDAVGPRLLGGPEQDVAVRELVEGAVEDGRSRWPAELGPALHTRGFADELRALLARARALDLEPADLRSASDRPDWRAAAAFFDEYLEVLDARGVLDYAELVLRAARLLAGPAGDAVRARYDLVLVDEFQDTDPAQEALLRGIAGDGRDLVVVGDPDQSIYAFRGADVRNILEFRRRFPHRDGSPAAVRALSVCRRSGPTLLAASRRVVAPLPSTAGVDVAMSRAHRDLRAAGADAAPAAASVIARTYPSDAAEADGIADLLRREHLENGRAWDSMAVLVRSATQTGARLRRALVAAGVPVEVAAAELPVAKHPAVKTLLAALECAADLARDERRGALSVETAQNLILSPLGGSDPAALRRLGRALRVEDLDEAGSATRSSAELVRASIEDPRLLAGLEPSVAEPARRVGAVLRAAAHLVRTGAPTYDVLWSIWSATPWPVRLDRLARRGGPDGRGADGDLDAVLALFEVVAQYDEQLPGRGAANLERLLAEQQIPGDTLAERGVRSRGVRLLTAHRAKGLEWDLVVVAGVQDERWPDLRRRGSLLEADRLGADGITPPLSTAALLAEERRLFYVAITRARERLVVTAVDSPLDDGVRPSRFLDDLGVEVDYVDRPSRRRLALPALVAELRRTAEDPSRSAELRRAAVARLALLADAREQEHVLVPSADPARWWSVADETRAELPLRPPDQPLHLSGSSLRGLGECPARWLLSHEVHGEGARTSALGFGSVLHAIADGVDRGVLEPDVDRLMSVLDDVWHELEFAAPWQREIERDAARRALSRLLVWRRTQIADGRRPVATEASFALTVEVEDREVDLRGAIDRIDLDADGRVVVVDYKTGRSKPSKRDVVLDPQLATYQYAVEQGALDEFFPDGRPEAGGAELVQLRHDRASDGGASVQPQPALRAPSGERAEFAPDTDGAAWFDVVLTDATARIVREQLPAIPGPRCGSCAFASSCPTQDAGRQVIT